MKMDTSTLVGHNRGLLEALFKEWEVPDMLQDALFKFLDKTDFFTAPASAHHHGNYESGLFDHSYIVTKYLCDWTKAGLIHWERPYSPVLVGMFHDLCKVGRYIPLEEEGEYEHNDEALTFGGHGSDSLCRLMLFTPLTTEEAMCIRWHMGAYEGKEVWSELATAIQAFPNVQWTHHADMLASKVDGV